jgi:hypothetical protein
LPKKEKKKKTLGANPPPKAPGPPTQSTINKIGAYLAQAKISDHYFKINIQGQQMR